MTHYAEMALVRGMNWLAEAQAAIAHNLANVDTAAFKRRSSMALPAAEDFEAVLGTQLPTIRYGERTDWRAGGTRETGHRLDVALGLDSYFRVQDARGRVFYTRDGKLQLDRDGRMVTAEGLRYLDQNGSPIQLSDGEGSPADVSIAPNGQITDPKTGRTWGTLGIVRLPDAQALQPLGNGLFEDLHGQVPAPVADGLQQGARENSNVDSLQELVQMIIVQRSFSATQRALNGVGRMQDLLIENLSR
jgi:flagellar basal body rod protein FlgG